MRASRRSGANGTLNKATVPLLPKNRLVKELQDRGLDTNGVQTVLADRLLEFLSAEDGSGPIIEKPVTPAAKKQPSVTAKKTPVTAKATKSATKPPPKRRSGRGAKNVKEEEPDEEEQEEEEEKVEEEPPEEVKKKKKTSTVNGRRSVKQEPPEEEPDEEQEVAETSEPAEEAPKKKKTAPVGRKRAVKQEPPEEEPETTEPAVPEEPPTPVNRRASKKQNKENATPAVKKKETGRKSALVVKIEEPEVADEPETSTDSPSTSDAVIAPTPVRKAKKEVEEPPKSDEKRSRRKSARLLASEQMEVDEEEEEAGISEVPEAEKEPEPEVNAPEKSKKKQKEVTVKQEVPEPEAEQVVRKNKKSIKEEPADSADESAQSDPDFQPREESLEPVRQSKRIKEHSESGGQIDYYQQIQKEKAERAEKLEKLKKSRPSFSSSQPSPAPKPPKQANWQVEWAAKMAMHKNASQKPSATSTSNAEGAKRKESGEKSTSEVPKKKKTVELDAIEALMTSTIKEKVEKKTSVEQRPDRIVAGSDASHDYSKSQMNKLVGGKNLPMISPQLPKPSGLFFNQPTVAPKSIAHPPNPIPIGFPPMIPMIPMVPGMLPPPPLPPVIAPGRRRQSRFDQPPTDQKFFASKANAPPPTLTTVPQISRSSQVISPPPPPPPRKRPSEDDIPPPPPKPKMAPTAPTSDLQRRVQELFSSDPAAPAVPVVFSPRESSNSAIPPPPPPPLPPPKRALVKSEPAEPTTQEESDDDDFVIRDTVVEASEPTAKRVKVEPRAQEQFVEEPVVIQHVAEEDNAPRAINKVVEARKKEALAAERRRRALELGAGDDDGEYNPGDDMTKDESEIVYEYQPTTARVEDEELEEIEEEEGDDDDDLDMIDDEGGEEEEDEEDEEEEEREDQDHEETQDTVNEDEGEDDTDGPMAINHNPMELLKRALPLLHSSTVTEPPKNDYAQLDVPASESLLTRQEEEQPAEVYYHGDPVPEVDENELYEIAAGLKPKKKEKKALVQIPEEERIPADSETIELDYYNADILVKSAEKNIWQIEPFCQDGLALMWGGIRSNFGIKLPFKQTEKDLSHRLAFQIQIEAYQSIQHLPTEFMSDGGDVRVGFSLGSSSLTMGEYPGSWCISASGKRAMNNLFTEFGKSFDVGDIVTCILDFAERSISYQINGKEAKIAFEKVPFNEGDIIFPTICTKNANINVNLGQELSDEKWKIPEERDWMFITEMDRSHFVRSHTAPASKKDCTVLMTVGLPGVGKTTWVNRYLHEHPHEHWTLISADVVMNAMKVNGVHRIRLPTLKRPDFLRGIIGKSMARLILLAPRRRKNYILDMTNCFADKRKRKLMAFEEFNRKCMIFVPDEDTHLKRLIKQEHEENEKLDTDAMMQHKAGMSLPAVGEGEPCEELIFIDPPAGNEHIVFERVTKMNYDCRSWLVIPGRRGRGGGYHNNYNRGNYHHQGYHQYNRQSNSGPSSNQYSPRNSISSMNITHTTFPSSSAPAVPSPLVRETIILPPVKITVPTSAQPSPSVDQSPASTSRTPVLNQFSFPPPAFGQAPPATASPSAIPQPIQDMHAQQQQVKQQIQQKVQQVQQTIQKKVEVSQPLTLNTSLPRKSYDTNGPSSALSSAGRSSSFSQNSPRFGLPSSKETTPVPSAIPTTTVPPPTVISTQMISVPQHIPVMNVSQPPPMMSVPPPNMAQMSQPPPGMLPWDMTVPPPNFSAPPPSIPAASPVAIPPHVMMLQQQMATPPPASPIVPSPYSYPPPQFTPR